MTFSKAALEAVAYFDVRQNNCKSSWNVIYRAVSNGYSQGWPSQAKHDLAGEKNVPMKTGNDTKLRGMASTVAEKIRNFKRSLRVS